MFFYMHLRSWVFGLSIGGLIALVGFIVYMRDECPGFFKFGLWSLGTLFILDIVVSLGVGLWFATSTIGYMADKYVLAKGEKLCGTADKLEKTIIVSPLGYALEGMLGNRCIPNCIRNGGYVAPQVCTNLYKKGVFTLTQADGTKKDLWQPPVDAE